MTEAIRLGPWPLGIDNVHAADHAVYQVPGRGDPPARLLGAPNVELNDEGWPRSRPGTVPWTTLTAGRRLCSAGGLLLCQDGDSLLRIDPADGSSEVLIDGLLDAEARCLIQEFQGAVLVTDGTACWRIRDGIVGAWGLDVPDTSDLSATEGTLPPGRYLVAVTARDADGHESGAVAPAEITLTEAGGISIDVPGDLDPRATVLAVYVSSTNQHEPMLFGLVGLDDLPLVVADLEDVREKIPLVSEGLRPPPAGIVALGAYRGYVLAGVGRFVFRSKGTQPQWWAWRTDVTGFPHAVTSVVAVADGWYCGTVGGLFWVSGEAPVGWTVTRIDSTPVRPGGRALSGGLLPALQYDGLVAVMVSADSLLLGLPGGVVRRETLDRYRFAGTGEVSVAYRPASDLRQVLVAVT